MSRGSTLEQCTLIGDIYLDILTQKYWVLYWDFGNSLGSYRSIVYKFGIIADESANYSHIQANC